MRRFAPRSEPSGRLFLAAHRFGARDAVGHSEPGILGAKAAVAHVVERRGIGLGAALLRSRAVEFKLGGERHLKSAGRFRARR
jgi:hypothetical protein